jgi:hypothetical protein
MVDGADWRLTMKPRSSNNSSGLAGVDEESPVGWMAQGENASDDRFKGGVPL